MNDQNAVNAVGDQIARLITPLTPSDAISVLVSTLVSLIAVKFPDNGAQVISKIAGSLAPFYANAIQAAPEDKELIH
jgi:hypothetical protein